MSVRGLLRGFGRMWGWLGLRRSSGFRSGRCSGPGMRRCCWSGGLRIRGSGSRPGERERISRGIAAGESGRAIARVLGRSASTVCREIRAGGGRGRYRAVRAECRAARCARRPKATKLSRCARLVAEVEAGLEKFWSPRQISDRLKADHPDDLEMRISPETIYLSLYVQSRGELRRQLSANLRSGRTKRRPAGRIQRQGRIAGMIPISQRPASVEDRAVPGHWEGDLIMGANRRSAVATLVERQTRYVMLAWLGNDHSTLTVIGECHKVCVRQERMEPHAFNTTEDPIPASLL